jgi:hypothetical protein
VGKAGRSIRCLEKAGRREGAQMANDQATILRGRRITSIMIEIRLPSFGESGRLSRINISTLYEIEELVVAYQKRGRLVRCWPSELFEILRQVLALAESALGRASQEKGRLHRCWPLPGCLWIMKY